MPSPKTEYTLVGHHRVMSDRERERADAPRRYDPFGRPVTGVVTGTKRVTHSQVWSKHGPKARLIMRVDDLALMRKRTTRNPNLPTWRVTSTGTATRI